MHSQPVTRKHFYSSYLLPYRQHQPPLTIAQVTKQKRGRVARTAGIFELQMARAAKSTSIRRFSGLTPRGTIISRALSPASIKPPFARYSHGIAVPAGHRLVVTSGQLGIGADAAVPADCEAQADLCFANIAAILAEDRMTLANIVRLNAYVTAREHMQGYMRSRDRQFPGTPPASTLMIVSGFTRAEFLVEIEAIAAAPEQA
jgi:enamine deaminase RidA (YjgF/YER057c/UK114 family)